MRSEGVEDAIFQIEKATSALFVVADALGNGDYSAGVRAEQAVHFIADGIRTQTELLRSFVFKGGADA